MCSAKITIGARLPSIGWIVWLPIGVNVGDGAGEMANLYTFTVDRALSNIHTPANNIGE
jgi:hypothetical protein